MNLQNEMIEHAGSRMAAAIDFEVLCGFLVELGWTKIVLTPMTSEKSDSIDHWLKTKCRGAYQTMGLVFVFEDEKDATWFTLKWS